jgi:hypothetical protein
VWGSKILNAESIMSGFDESDDDDNESDEHIQLGFLESNFIHPILFEEKNWLKWDGGKVGGKPVFIKKSWNVMYS